MKKTVVLVLAIVLTSVLAHAQEVALGIKGGLNFASLNGSTGVQANYKNHTGFNAGAFMLFKLSKIGIQPEILFSQQGSQLTINTTNVKSNFSYVNVPILLKLYTLFGINIQVGPQFGFLSSAKAVTNFSGTTTTMDIKNDLHQADLSAALGLGWDLPFGLSIDARYNLGLTKITTGSDPSNKNQVIQISVGYKLIKLGH